MLSFSPVLSALQTQKILDDVLAKAEKTQKEFVAEVVSVEKFGHKDGDTLYVKAEIEHEIVVAANAVFKDGSPGLYSAASSKFQLDKGTKKADIRLVNVKGEDCKLLKFQICTYTQWKLKEFWPKSPEFEAGDKNIDIEMDKPEDVYLVISFNDVEVARNIFLKNPGAGFAIVESK